MKKIILITSLIFYTQILYAKKIEDKKFLTIKTNRISNISANHKQGSIIININKKYYMYYIKSKDEIGKIIATSIIFKDIKESKEINFSHVKYGIHRRITNLQTFYK